MLLFGTAHPKRAPAWCADDLDAFACMTNDDDDDDDDDKNDKNDDTDVCGVVFILLLQKKRVERTPFFCSFRI